MDGKTKNNGSRIQVQRFIQSFKKCFINGLNDDKMVEEITWELTSVVDSSSVTGEQLLTWAKRLEIQRTQTAMLECLKETKDVDAIRF